MAQNKELVQYSNFVAGLNTESTQLNFPENATAEEDNMVLNVDGSRQRRLGVVYETGNAITDTGSTISASTPNEWNFFRWDNADNKSTNSIGVVQHNKKLWFMDMFSSAPSANLLNGGSSVSIVATGTAPELDFAVVNGLLIIVSDLMQIHAIVSYDTATDTITLSQSQNIQVRDLWGVQDDLDIDERPASLSNQHQYNIRNQGWSQARYTTFQADAVTGNLYPSNADLVHLGRVADTTTALFGFDSQQIVESYLGNTPAPKGKYIIDFYFRGASRLTNTGIQTGSVDSELGRFETVASQFGRLFYAGIESSVQGSDDNSPNASSLILYTQVITKDTQTGTCYQEADPTSGEISDLIDTDGGFISIPSVGKVIKMVPLSNQLVILAENGVWSVVAEGPFTPTNYEVQKVSDVGAIARRSVIAVEGSVIYWSKSGIYSLGLDDISAKAKVTDVTLGTIKTFYNSIDSVAKTHARGYYDSVNKQIGWLYNNETSYDTVNNYGNCTRELIYDIKLKAFYHHTHSQLSSDSPYVVGVVTGQNIATSDVTSLIEVNGDQVQANVVDVQVTTESRLDATTKIKYLTFVPDTTSKFTLSIYGATTFLDWVTADYTSYLLTGSTTFKDFTREKGIPFLVMHFIRTEDGFTAGLAATSQSSCLVQTRWEWTDTSDSNRWGTQFESYRYRRPYVAVDANDTFETGHELISTRNKLRGRGRALALHMTSTSGKDMQILGWALSVTGGTQV